MAKCAAGNPVRFITLTINPRVGTSPEARLKILSHAWRTIVKRAKRRFRSRPLSYLAIVEQTKRGEPHLHILYRGPFLPHRWLSNAMDQLAQSPIVDIRRIRNQREVIRYVAKYVTKAPAHFSGSKRYWSSQDWEPRFIASINADDAAQGDWEVWKHALASLAADFTTRGYAITPIDDDSFLATPVKLEWNSG